MTKILCHSNGDIWLSCGSGLIRYIESTNETKVYSMDSSLLASNSITYLYEDRSGVIWIGTNKGISILNTEQQFTNSINSVLFRNNLYENSIKSFLEDSDNDLWIGTEENGVIQFDISEGKIIRFVCDNNSQTPY